MSENKHINNVCYCECHLAHYPKCRKCQTLHIAQEKPATHPNDTFNPDY